MEESAAWSDVGGTCCDLIDTSIKAVLEPFYVNAFVDVRVCSDSQQK